MALAIGNLLDTGGRAKHRFNAIFYTYFIH